MDKLRLLLLIEEDNINACGGPLEKEINVG